MTKSKSGGEGPGPEPSWLETELAELEALREERSGDARKTPLSSDEEDDEEAK